MSPSHSRSLSPRPTVGIIVSGVGPGTSVPVLELSRGILCKASMLGRQRGRGGERRL